MRIGVNVPNELLVKVKEIDPIVNVSQLVREALQRRVDIAELATARAIQDGVESQVDRLDASVRTSILEPDWVAYALEDAREWVWAATSQTWERFIYEIDFLRAQGRDPTEFVRIWSHGDEIRGLEQRLHDNRDWFEQRHELGFQTGNAVTPYEEAESEYARAWLSYVNEVRRLLELRRKEELDRLMAERKNYRAALPHPEAPTQLL